MEHPAEITIQNNIFIGGITLPSWSAAGDHLIVEDNSFIGYNAINYEGTYSLDIGSNYYGDKGGLVHTPGVFLETRGARYIGTSYSKLTVAAPQLTGRYPDDPKVFPDIWTMGFVIGQNVLAHDHHPGNHFTGWSRGGKRW